MFFLKTLTNSSIFLESKSLKILDVSEPWQIDFQDPATPIMESIVNLHHTCLFFGIVVFWFVLYFLIITIYMFYKSKYILETYHIQAEIIEVIWTIIPTFIVLAIGFPSFSLIYSLSDNIQSNMVLKIIGRQWYWTYELFNSVENVNNKTSGVTWALKKFDSFILPTQNILENKHVGFRLLEVTEFLVLPIKEHIHVLVSSSDVIHSWAVPSLGIKVDAAPGRSNYINLFLKRSGTYYGQCSEICGIKHAFMPIAVIGTPLDRYDSWWHSELKYVKLNINK